MLCFVPHCQHYNDSYKCHFYRFPKEKNLRLKWIKAIRRKDKQPSESSRVCSCHFKDGIRDHTPSIFPWNASKVFQFQSPVKKKPENLIDEILRNVSANETEIENPNDKSTQTMNSVQGEAEHLLLNSEIDKLKSEVGKLKNQPFGYYSIEHDDELVVYYTGINKTAFKILSDLVSSSTYQYFYEWKPARLSITDQLLMTLMKLRLNFGYIDLAVRFNTSKHTVGNIILTFLHLLHEILFEGCMNEIPSQIKNSVCLPNCFHLFKNCRIVLDCTEFRCQIPHKLDEQKRTYSNYKHGNTLKALIGIAPNGVITYASSMYPGNTSDKNIVQHCGILKQLKKGDLILADKGFLLKDILPPDVSVNVPPFLMSPQFTPSEVEKTQNIARARIHVERAIGRLKNFHILHFIPKTLFNYSSKVLQVCVALTNYDNPLLKEMKDGLKCTPCNDTIESTLSEDELFGDE